MTSFTLSTFFIIAYNPKEMILFNRLALLFCLLTPFGACFAQTAAPQPSPLASKGVIRFLVPLSSMPSGVQKELSSIVDQYNRLHKDHVVQLIRRGDQYSSLRELIAMHLAGDTPEIAVIEASEGPAITQLDIVKPLRLKVSPRPELIRPDSAGWPALPFLRTVPVLVANSELLGKLSSPGMPRNWKELEAKARSALAAGVQAPIALPLQGSHGLWIFESLAEPPLWQREQGGLRSERRLASGIRSLQAFLDNGLARVGESAESATQSFVDRKALFLITSLDALPELKRKISFPITTGSLFTTENRPALLMGGSDIIVTKDSSEIWNFLNYLFSEEIAKRWLIAGGWLPPIAGWSPGPEAAKNMIPRFFRTTDSEVVRARSAWVRSLPLLFGPAEKRLPPEEVFVELDRHLNPR